MLGGRSPLGPEGFRRADIQALPPEPCFHGSGLCHSPGTAPLNISPGGPASSQRTTKLKKMMWVHQSIIRARPVPLTRTPWAFGDGEGLKFAESSLTHEATLLCYR